MIIVRQLLPELLERVFLHVVGRSGFQKSGAVGRRNSKDKGLVRAHVLTLPLPAHSTCGFQSGACWQGASKVFAPFPQIHPTQLCRCRQGQPKSWSYPADVREQERESECARAGVSTEKYFRQKKEQQQVQTPPDRKRSCTSRVECARQHVCMHACAQSICTCLLSTGVTSDSFKVFPSFSNEARISSRDRDPLPDRKKTFAHWNLHQVRKCGKNRLIFQKLTKAN